MENLGLERATRVDRHDHFLSRGLAVTEGDMAAYLMIPVPPRSFERPDEPIPGEVPGKFAHAETSTVHSGMVLSSGIASPCLRQLSR